MKNETHKLHLNEEEKDFMMGVLECIKEDLEMDIALEYGCLIQELIEKLNKSEVINKLNNNS